MKTVQVRTLYSRPFSWLPYQSGDSNAVMFGERVLRFDFETDEVSLDEGAERSVMATLRQKGFIIWPIRSFKGRINGCNFTLKINGGGALGLARFSFTLRKGTGEVLEGPVWTSLMTLTTVSETPSTAKSSVPGTSCTCR